MADAEAADRRDPADPESDPPVMGRAFWEERYQSASTVWSGDPNPHLVAAAAELAPGHALDIGAGEGADAIWLAERGWTVSAVDISATALDRGRTEAESRGSNLAERIDWLELDILAEPLPPGPFDLVTLGFMHFLPDERDPLHRRAAERVAPDGMLHIVGHHPDDLLTNVGRPPTPEALLTPEDLANVVDDTWVIDTLDAIPRTQSDKDGNNAAVRDTVLTARRRG